MVNETHFKIKIYPMIIKSDSLNTIQWLQSLRVLKKQNDCKNCDLEMELKKCPDFLDGYKWQCPSDCTISDEDSVVTSGSFFYGSRIALKHWLHIIYLWGNGTNLDDTAKITNVEKSLLELAYKDLRLVCNFYFTENTYKTVRKYPDHFKIGGENLDVLTDYEFSTSQINDGTIRKRIFLMLDISKTPNVGYFEIYDRYPESAMKAAENKFICPKSNIRRVNLENEDEKAVLESYWAKYEYLQSDMKSCTNADLEDYLSQIMWLDRFGIDIIGRMIDHIRDCGSKF